MDKEYTPKPPEDEFQKMVEKAREQHEGDICGAWARNAGKVCTRPPRKGRSRCKIHGGDTPVGINSPHYKHGRYSKALPDRAAARYQDLLDDPEILGLKDDAALLAMRLEQTIEDAFAGRSATAWADMKTAIEKFHYWRENQNTEKMVEAIHEMEEIVREGERQAEAWEEAREIINLRRKVVRDEHKRRSELKQMMTAEEAYMLGRALLQAVQRNVDDPDVQRQIGQEVREILN